MAKPKWNIREATFREDTDMGISKKVSDWLNFTGTQLSIASWVDNDLKHNVVVVARFGNSM